MNLNVYEMTSSPNPQLSATNAASVASHLPECLTEAPLQP